MNKNEIVLLNLLKKSLFGTDVTFPEDTDWEAVKKEAANQAVLALAATALPESESLKWRELSAQSTAHYMRVLFEQKNLVNLFQTNNIPMVILKGTAAAVYYPGPKLRTMGDIDFIVDPERYNDAIELLKKDGYAKAEEHDNDRHCGFFKGGITLELHHRYSHEGVDIEPIITDGIQNSVTRTLNGYSFPTLPDYENGFVILEHIFYHMRDGIGIRQVIDWAMFANRFLTDENYKKHFVPLIESAHLVTFAETVTKMCKMYLGLPDTFSWCDSVDENTATELMEIIINKGNFGIKEFCEESKPMKGLVFEIKREGFFKTLQEIGVSNFGICQKNRFFRAFAWLFQLLRFAVRGTLALFRGKNLIKDMNEGNKKSDLYRRLGL